MFPLKIFVSGRETLTCTRLFCTPILIFAQTLNLIFSVGLAFNISGSSNSTVTHFDQ